jgi:drug/metabolite transporter (DMT)-like permease
MAFRMRVFDIRLIIALLIGVYGLVITIMGGWFTSDEEIERSAGININLWAGLGMLLAAAAFLVWAWLRPLAAPGEGDLEPSDPAAGNGENTEVDAR